MKIQIVLTVLLFSECTFCVAQQNSRPLTSANLVNQVDHPYIRCATLDYIKWVEQKDTTFKSKIAAAGQVMRNWEASEIANGHSAEEASYSVPVVVHVLWGNASQEISLQQIKTQIKVLNTDYNRLNSDT